MHVAFKNIRGLIIIRQERERMDRIWVEDPPFYNIFTSRKKDIDVGAELLGGR